MKFRSSFLFFLCYTFIINLSFAQENITSKTIVDDLVYKSLNIDFERSPGFVVGVINGDSSFVFSYGTVDKKTRTLPSSQSLFEIGNLTNIFTAQLVNILVEEGKLEKDISINNYLPDSLQNWTNSTITIQKLLTHTSGLPRVPLGIGMTQKEDNQPYAFYSKTMLIQYFKNYDFSTAEIGKYNYSHLGYALLELIVEYKTGEDFEDVLQEFLLDKKYLNTQLKLLKSEKELLVQGFDKSHQPTSPWKYSSFEGAVGLKSNINDLLILLRENIDTENYNMMQKALVPSGMKKNVFVGEGWHIVQQRRHNPIILHTGATSGYRGYMAFVKETRTGVVVLSNSEYALRGLGYFILKEMNKGFK